MKKHWAKLLQIATKMSRQRSYDGKVNYLVADRIYTNLFLKHHQHADTITIDKEGRPLAAEYKCGDMRDPPKKAILVLPV